MPAIIDYPDATRRVDPRRFNVYGWVWLADAQSRLAAVEAWSGETLLGRAESLALRPDVTAAHGLSADARTGFDFVTDHPAPRENGEFDLHLRLFFRDGTRTEPCARRRVKIEDLRPPPVPAPSPVTPAGASAGLLPPDHLQVRQVGTVWGSHFYTEGRVILDQVAALFREAGHPLEEAGSILDFGCGCGRLLANFPQFPHRGEIWGSDLDGESIAWNQAHLGHVGQFRANAALPPTAFRDGQFDAIYTISVFTHLPEAVQFAWLAELRRILRPGGILVATVHSRDIWEANVQGQKAEVEERGFAYRKGDYTEGLPEHYMSAYHSEAYIRAHWTWFFELAGFREKYIHGHQAAAVLRRRDD